jgi:flagellar assembly protein FliH
MSSSPSRAPIPSWLPAPEPRKPLEAVPFPYDEAAPAGGHTLPPVGSAPAGAGGAAAPGVTSQLLERENQARAQGRQQGELESRAKFEEQLARERAAITAAIAEFARERAVYYQKIEPEVVQLALSIARKILHREAQVDPLLLMGVVRVALEQIEGVTGVVLAVHPQRAAEWRRYLASFMDPKNLPEIVDDPALAAERCELRTSMGSAPLGVEVQLKEIEQGFADLLAARPGQSDKR